MLGQIVVDASPHCLQADDLSRLPPQREMNLEASQAALLWIQGLCGDFDLLQTPVRHDVMTLSFRPFEVRTALLRRSAAIDSSDLCVTDQRPSQSPWSPSCSCPSACLGLEFGQLVEMSEAGVNGGEERI